MFTFGLESSLISNPGQSKTLAFGGDPVRVALVGVTSSRFLLVSVLSVSVFAITGRSGNLLLGVSFIASGSIRSSVTLKTILCLTFPKILCISIMSFYIIPPCSAAVEIADVGLADDGNLRSFVFRLVAGRSGGSEGQESGDDELFQILNNKLL